MTTSKGRTFVAYREGIKPVVLTPEGHVLDPTPSLALANHSPGGFEWGYGGSGPAQLALAMLLYLYGDEIALACYQDFKSDAIARTQEWGFKMDVEDIQAWVACKIQQQKGVRT